MIIIMKPGSTSEEIRQIEEEVRDLGYEPHTIEGEVRTVVACVGDETAHESLEALVSVGTVEQVMRVQKRFKLISRQTQPEPTVVRVGDQEIGGGSFHVISGPCAVESEEQMMETAHHVKAAGATILRGGAYKPRTSPYDFQGLGPVGLEYLRKAGDETGMPVVTEVLRESDVDKVAKYADMLQIGARNGMNYALIEAVAMAGKPVLLKRGLSATIEEWLLAAEYMVKKGNRQIILCERGIRTFETATRNTLDVSAIAIAKLETSLPVIADPTHAGGRLDIIQPLARAAVGAGADGVVVECHRDPHAAKSDAAQQLTPEALKAFVNDLQPWIAASGLTPA
jgi:3-deoxy-7-phosphoheptulonate synthase